MTNVIVKMTSGAVHQFPRMTLEEFAAILDRSERRVTIAVDDGKSVALLVPHIESVVEV